MGSEMCIRDSAIMDLVGDPFSLIFKSQKPAPQIGLYLPDFPRFQNTLSFPSLHIQVQAGKPHRIRPVLPQSTPSNRPSEWMPSFNTIKPCSTNHEFR